MLAAPLSGLAQAAEADRLAQQLANPISSLTSVPLQFNYIDGLGVNDEASRTFLNVQPVVPVSIGENWNLISRTIVPIIYQEGVFPGAGSQFGTGDVLQSLFFSPKALTASGWTWGIGPVLLLPTASDDLLGGEKWGGGPTAVVLKQTPQGWTYGALVNHIWSFAGDDDRADVSSTFLQPFVARGVGQGRTVSASLESTFDWKARQWTIPVNFFYSKVSRIGSQMVSYQGGINLFVDSPAGGPEWGVRFTLTFLYPRR
ncbi:transporter [Lysobacter sp. MMG2]|nr:transporter [Lysobacter sp. MMG2]